MNTRFLLKVAALLAIGSTALAACGDGTASSTSTTRSSTSSSSTAGSSDAASSPGTRTVEIQMQDIKFTPDSVNVAAGETVRFVFKNEGAVVHDAFIGDESAQAAHETEMQEDSAHAGMNHGGGNDEGGATVEPGGSGELTHTFKSGEHLLIGCHQPGHYVAGMKATVNVI